MAEDRKFKFENGQFINRVSGKAIPDDEPVILFRARDRHAVGLLLMYQDMAQDDHHKAAIQDRINEFTQFQIDHPERMKEPGVTRHIQLNQRPDGFVGMHADECAYFKTKGLWPCDKDCCS